MISLILVQSESLDTKYMCTKMCEKSLNQNPYIEKGQAKQWPKEKGQMNKHWSIKQYIEN